MVTNLGYLQETPDVRTTGDKSLGMIEFTKQMLKERPSGDHFGWMQTRAMGIPPEKVLAPEFMILSTLGGMVTEDGELFDHKPTWVEKFFLNPVKKLLGIKGKNHDLIAAGLHSGHFELGMLVKEASAGFKANGKIPYASYATDTCDGRSMGTPAMMDSLASRNFIAILMGIQARGLPNNKGTLGIATCDKGLPATMMALGEMHDLPTVIVPGGVMLKAENADGHNTANIQAVGSRVSTDEMTLEAAQEGGCKSCGSAGGGCQFLGTAGTNQVVAEALGWSLPHSALAPSGEDIWKQLGRDSAQALVDLEAAGTTTKDIITQDSIYNAMVVHAAFGGSSNLVLHMGAIAHSAGLEAPTVKDWEDVNRATPRLVEVLPNHPSIVTSQLFMAGGVPEVMLHLRNEGLLRTDAMTVTGQTLGENLDEWEKSPRRESLRQQLLEKDGLDPSETIMSPEQAKAKGLTGTLTFPTGNICPEGSLIKSTAIDPKMVDDDGVYRAEGEVRVFAKEKDAIEAVKNDEIKSGDIIVLMGSGPKGIGMEETFQLTGALKELAKANPEKYGKITLITDGRFSGVSTGACIGHVGPEALADGPIGKLQDGDVLKVEIDTINLIGKMDFVGTRDNIVNPDAGATILAGRDSHPDLAPHENLSASALLWAEMQDVSGGPWQGSVVDTEKIVAHLNFSKACLQLAAQEPQDAAGYAKIGQAFCELAKMEAQFAGALESYREVAAGKDVA